MDTPDSFPYWAGSIWPFMSSNISLLINFSMILLRFIKPEMGLKSSVDKGLSTFGIGVTTSCFKKSGHDPSLIELLINFVIGFTNWYEKYLNILAGTSVFLSDLFTSRFCRTSRTSSSSKTGISSFEKTGTSMQLRSNLSYSSEREATLVAIASACSWSDKCLRLSTSITSPFLSYLISFLS